MHATPDEPHNPYAPPTNLGSGEARILPATKLKRPISVWLMQVFMFMFAGLFTYSCIRTVGDFGALATARVEVWKIAVALALQIAFIFAFAATAIALFRRAKWSKWVSLALLLLLIAFVILRPDTTYYANDAERFGGFIGRYLFFPPLFIWWAYALAFSQKAKRYFSTETD